MASSSLPTKYLVIGAGPSGLIAARAFLRYGIDVEIVERHTRAGGIWDIENPGSPIYESCNLISSRIAGGFAGYPMKSDLPMYPKWTDLRDYIGDFARDYGLDERTTFGTSVVSAEPVDTDAGRSWRVELSNGETREYRGIVAATGSQWIPRLPAIDGLDTFNGHAIHSSEYRSPEDLRGKRVLVVGAGNSGIDIASDAAFHADAAFLSTRRAYWIFPKQIFGLALPDLLDGRGSLPDLELLQGLDPQTTMALVMSTVGDMTAYGLPTPSDPPASTHPIVSNTILHAFSHGLLSHRNDVARVDGSTVHFVDGVTEEVDVIVFATGYDVHYDFLPEGLVTYKDGHPVVHLTTFVPGVEGLYTAGTLHAAVGAGWTLWDVYANLAAADAHATLTGENAEALRRLKEEYDPDLTGGFPFLDVPRNANQYDGYTVLVAVPAEIREKFGIALPTGFDDMEFYREVRRTDEATVHESEPALVR
ncbi:flavin-containing monooxygenase [Microbacterium koreense]|uniref:Flavin-containing monooxygenase n=1 Tax=Microbacterium koreense TaxID=323761 RepID=A0ABW2ZQS0_9MICO